MVPGVVPAEYRARHVAGLHAAVDSGHLAHGGAVAGVEALFRHTRIFLDG